MKRSWVKKFRKSLIKREAKSSKRVRNLMKSGYEDVVRSYSHSKTPSEISENFLSVEQVDGIVKQIYKDIYVWSGMWNGNRYLKQKNLHDDLLEFLMSKALTAAEIESLVKRNLILSNNRDIIADTIIRFREDPDFIALNEEGAKRYLMAKFSDLSKNRAKTIVRTEATNAANKAVMDSMERLFPGRTLSKEWVAAKDSRTRLTHRQADGQTVLKNKKFFVGGELLDHPGAGKKPENNIYCRCVIIPKRNG